MYNEVDMYYSQPCSHCSYVFYTYNDNKEIAAQKLFDAIKKHLIETGEDDKETKYDYGATQGTNQIYGEMTSSNEPPSGGYQV